MSIARPEAPLRSIVHMAIFVRMLRRLGCVATFALVGAALGPATMSAAAISVPGSLAVSDLSPGFKVIGVPLLREPCAELYLPSDATSHEVIGFRSASMAIEEALAWGKHFRTIYEELDDRYATCRTFRGTSNQGSLRGSGRKLEIPRVGVQSQAFSFRMKVNRYQVNDVVVVFRERSACGVLTFISSEGVDLASVDSIASTAASKAGTVAS